jgi:diguanylate cyclase (GGDEF)-like protein/PAS domain S-box-containing protein
LGILAGRAAWAGRPCPRHLQAASLRAGRTPLRFIPAPSRWREVTMSQEQGLDREGTLQRAGAALARAGTADGAGAIACRAVEDLIGQGRDHEALLAVDRGGELTVVATCSGGRAPSGEIVAFLARWLPRARQLEPAGPKLVPVAGLVPEGQAGRAGFESLLLCPLVVTNRPSGDLLIGVLVVLGEHDLLSGMSPALRALSGQVAQALGRVPLSEEAVRQRGGTLFRALVRDSADVILVLDDDMTVRHASPSATRLYGDIPIEGAKADSLVAEAEMVHVAFDPGTSEDVYSGLYRITRHDGKKLLVEVWASDLRYGETVRGRVVTSRDVTGEHQPGEQPSHDALTGLPNRALLADLAGHAVAAARRNGTTAAVLSVDLDDFKVLNDRMGHAAGDDLLACAARRLAAVAGKSGTAARLCGDEFALLIRDLADPAAAEAHASRVIAAFSEPFELPAGPVLAGANVGVATTADSSDAGELVRHAGLSLHAARSQGKRRWHRYTPALSAGMAKRHHMQAMLGDAVARSAFTLAYQPVAALATGAVRGFEALLRWPHPAQETVVPPEDLVGLAEETGLIVPLGTWILRQAITDMARWHGKDPGPGPRQPKIGINIAARQIRDPGFVPGLRRCLDETGLAPSAVLLELTESSLLSHDEQVTSVLAKVKDLGVRLVIDDFGTGYSSLSYLRKFPIDVLKIDKSFVDAVTEPQGRKFVEIIIDFARAIEVDIVAEGIETEQQRALLTARRHPRPHRLTPPPGGEGAEPAATPI